MESIMSNRAQRANHGMSAPVIEQTLLQMVCQPSLVEVSIESYHRLPEQEQRLIMADLQPVTEFDLSGSTLDGIRIYCCVRRPSRRATGLANRLLFSRLRRAFADADTDYEVQVRLIRKGGAR